MKNIRKAALRIHSLEKADRQWLLNQLSPAERNFIESSLDELTNLGLASDTSLDGSFDELFIRAQASIADEKDGGHVGILHEQPPELIFQALDQEPDWIVALVLSHSDWDWTGYVVGEMEGERAKRICELSKNLGSVNETRLGASVANHFAEKLEQRHPEHKEPGRFEAMLGNLHVNRESDDVAQGKVQP